MTAEVAILNRFGVALAADSAVTIETKAQGSKRPKIYQSSNKLFTLSKYQPVGIMIFGNVTLLGLPWETIIKIYRRALGTSKFKTLEEYALDFRKYLAYVVPEYQQEKYFTGNLVGYYTLIKNEIKKQVEEITQKQGSITPTDIKKIVSSTIENHFKRLQNKNAHPEIPDYFPDELGNKYINIIKENIDIVFEQLPRSKQDTERLQAIAGLLFTREESIKDICPGSFFPSEPSGIVIAGYGDEEVFPSLIELTIDGVLDGIAKCKIDTSEKITFDQTAVIMPFAQGEMVSIFMEGVSPDYQDAINSALSQIFMSYPKILLDNLPQIPDQEKDKVFKKLLSVGKVVLNDINNGLNRYKRDAFIGPILTAVGVLPKDELAIMAETLVNLTSFKRKMSMEMETVGGPIDVALISKGDGFVWIKRKHYFQAELNHHFFSNYFREEKADLIEEEGNGTSS